MKSRTFELEHAPPEFRALVEHAMRGEEVVLTREGEPVARIVPVSSSLPRRTFGSARGLIRIADDFDDPLEEFREYQ